MRRFLAAVLLASVPGALAADPVEGRWRTQPDDNGNSGVVAFAPCGSGFCGTLVAAFDKAGKPRSPEKIGTRIVSDMAAEGGGRYGGGTVYAPDRDKTYRSKMALEGDRLTVSGCVGPFCRKQVWTRAR